jgi:glycosyltransferase involved in cell wall biosynthesis
MVQHNIIVPAHNEAEHISTTIETLTALYPDHIITVATDGNTDATTEIAMELSLKHPNVFVNDYPFRIGKGAAIKQSLILGTTNTYIDADLPINPYAIHAMEQITQQTNGLTITKRTSTNRNFKRTTTSKIYNNLVRLLFRTGISDHQCGLKTLSPKASAIALTCESNDFFFDTELIIRCKKANIPVTEYNAMWTENKKHSTVHVLSDSQRMLKQLCKLWFKEIKGKF